MQYVAPGAAYTSRLSLGPDFTGECPALVRRFLTPTNASHTYKITGYRLNSDGVIVAGAGGVDTPVPGYIRITVA